MLIDTNYCNDLTNKDKNNSRKDLTKHNEKHVMLRGTIEKLKAKSDFFKKKSSHDFKSESQLNSSFCNNQQGKVTSDTKGNKETKCKKKQNANIEALTLATAETLKDINKWLDDSSNCFEFGSASNSPLSLNNDQKDENIRKVQTLSPKPTTKKDVPSKDLKKRSVLPNSLKILRKRETQRTIDRLQPGKSKGNLLSTSTSTSKPDESSIIAAIKIKDNKSLPNSCTDKNTPKLNLGSVINNFEKHTFVDDNKVKEDKVDEQVKKDISEEKEIVDKNDVSQKENTTNENVTPNLSAWFKAFGAPKITSVPKKESDLKETKTLENESTKTKDDIKTISSSQSPGSPTTSIQPTKRQRKMSNGSTISEQSSFSQDTDSPNVGIDERLGAYPAPYPSPLYNSPTGGTSTVSSPRADVSPKASYANFNGQMRVGFYQDTVSLKNSPDKSCSPQHNSASSTSQKVEHISTSPNTHNKNYYYENHSFLNNTDVPQSFPKTYEELMCNTNKLMPNPYLSSNYNDIIPQRQKPSDPLCYENQVNCNDRQQLISAFPVKKRFYNNDISSVSQSEPSQENVEFSNEKIDNIKTLDSIGTSNTYTNLTTPSIKNPPVINERQVYEIAGHNNNYPSISNYGFHSNNVYQTPTVITSKHVDPNYANPNYLSELNYKTPELICSGEVSLLFIIFLFINLLLYILEPNVAGQNFLSVSKKSSSSAINRFIEHSEDNSRSNVNSHLHNIDNIGSEQYLKGNSMSITHLPEKYSSEQLSPLETSDPSCYIDRCSSNFSTTFTQHNFPFNNSSLEDNLSISNETNLVNKLQKNDANKLYSQKAHVEKKTKRKKNKAG